MNSNLIIGHGFDKFYEKHLSAFIDKKFDLLEIGTWKGASSAAFAIVTAPLVAVISISLDVPL